MIIAIVIACILLVGVVLIQNPKGGGLSQAFGGFNNQLMGVQRTTDFLEKATWYLMGGIAVVSLVTVFFLSKGGSTTQIQKSAIEGVAIPGNNSTQLNNQQNAVPLVNDTAKKAQ